MPTDNWLYTDKDLVKSQEVNDTIDGGVDHTLDCRGSLHPQLCQEISCTHLGCTLLTPVVCQHYYMIIKHMFNNGFVGFCSVS